MGASRWRLVISAFNTITRDVRFWLIKRKRFDRLVGLRCGSSERKRRRRLHLMLCLILLTWNMTSSMFWLLTLLPCKIIAEVILQNALGSLQQIWRNQPGCRYSLELLLNSVSSCFRDCALNALGSRSWPFRVTWRHSISYLLLQIVFR